jgi:hypothetical protein
MFFLSCFRFFLVIYRHLHLYSTYLRLFSVLGGAKLEFQKLVFSSSNYFLSLSGIPDFELVLW